MRKEHAKTARQTDASEAMAPKKEGSAKSAKVGNLYLQVLSAGSSDAPPGLLLFCELHGDRCGYLINCGEGTQRFCTEHKLRLAGKLRRALFTRMTWDELGGLPGMLLTMASTGHAGSLQLHGAPALPRLVSSFCHFMPRAALPHSTHAVRTGEPIAFEESGIVATPILLRPDCALPGLGGVGGPGGVGGQGGLGGPGGVGGVGGPGGLGDEAPGWEGTARPGDVAECVLPGLSGEAAGGEAAGGEALEGAAKRQRLDAGGSLVITPDARGEEQRDALAGALPGYHPTEPAGLDGARGGGGGGMMGGGGGGRGGGEIGEGEGGEGEAGEGETGEAEMGGVMGGGLNPNPNPT